MNLKTKLKILKNKTYGADFQAIYCETLNSQIELQHYSDGCTHDLTKKGSYSAFYYYIYQKSVCVSLGVLKIYSVLFL